MTREEITSEAIRLVNKHDAVILEWGTGVGKTSNSLRCMKDIGGKWLVVLSETAAIKNWHDDIIKHGLQDLLMDIEFVLYASLHKHIGMSYEGIICDEAQHISELRADILSNINHRKFIGLSATLNKDVSQRIEQVVGHCYYFKIPLKLAVHWGILPKPKIHLIKLELDNMHCDQEITICKGTKSKRIVVHCKYEDRWGILKQHSHVEIICSCTQQQKYDHLCEQIEFYKKQYFAIRNKALENKWLLTATNRKRFLAECKTPHLKQLLSNIQGRYICFAGSIKQCNEVGGRNVVHSKVKDPQLIIDRFNNYQIDNLYAVGMLKEVVNLKEANVIITQLDSGTRATVQMVGRGLRNANPEIYILYYTNTQDEVYLNNSLDEFKDLL